MPAPNSPGHFPYDLAQCPRCMEEHKQLIFKSLRIPCASYNAWATCPNTKEPIISTMSMTVTPPVKSRQRGDPAEEKLAEANGSEAK